MNKSTSIFLLSLLLTLIAFALPETMAGQTMKVEGQVFVIDKDNSENNKETPRLMFYVVVKSNRAEKVKTKIDELKNKHKKNLYDVEKNFRIYCEIEKIALKQTMPNGVFEELSVMPGASFVFFSSAFNSQIESVQKIVRNKGKVIFDDGNNLDDVTISGKRTIIVEPLPTVDTEDEIIININSWFKKGRIKDNTRLTIQPCIVDCSTEDTIHYLKPLVYDASTYYTIQDKRMDYDYKKNDPVAKYQKSDLKDLGEKPGEYQLRTTVIYSKTKKEKLEDKKLKGCYPIYLDDFTHKTHYVTGYTTCNRIRPMKFIDFSLAAVDLPLSDEFKEIAKANPIDVPRDLKLKFESNSAILTKDSTNLIESQKMGEELRSYGDDLWGVSVEGGASPEGSISRNTLLANQRAQVAKSMILQHVRGILTSQDIKVLPPKVYTWEDAAKELEKLGFKTEADTVRHFIKALGDKGNINLTLKRILSNYDTTIKVALENLRVMKCSYTYTTNKVLTPEEAADKYYNDPQYKDGTKHFSDGDFYNLFSVIKDSAELEKLIPFAYKEITRKAGYEKNKFSPYIAVKMANLQQKKGIVDLNILRPFIHLAIDSIKIEYKIDSITKDTISADTTKGSFIAIDKDKKEYFDSLVPEAGHWIINRKEILINQAIMYFKSMDSDTAKAIVNVMPDEPKIQNLKHFLNLKLYFRPNELKTEEQIVEGEKAFDFVINSNLTNKAILYTEYFTTLKDILGITWQETYDLIDQMDDTDPRKWYLFGMLHADSKYLENERNLVFDETANLKRLDELITGLETSDQELLKKLSKENFKQYRLLTTKEEDDLYDTDNKKYNFYSSIKKRYNELESEWLNETGGIKKRENNTKQFLAYFQHCFDLDHSCKFLYFEEGNINEELVRKKHRYKRQEIPLYRERFEEIMKAREYERKNKKESEDSEQSTEESNTSTTE